MSGTQLDQVTSRRMRWWDISDVVTLDAQLFDDTSWSAAMFWSELAGVPETRDYVVLTTGIDGVVIGYGGLMTVAGEATVQTLGVAHECQGQGLGRRLLAELVALARGRGASMVWLEVRADNEAAQRLYAAAGFEREAVRADYYGKGRDALIMRLRLTGADGGEA